MARTNDNYEVFNHFPEAENLLKVESDCKFDPDIVMEGFDLLEVQGLRMISSDGDEGVVFEVQDCDGRAAAVKVVEVEMKKMFWNDTEGWLSPERRLWKNLDHDLLVPLEDYTYVECGDSCFEFYLMPLYTHTLEDLRTKKGQTQFTTQDLQSIGRQLFTAASYLHDQNRYHLDIHCGNIFFKNDSNLTLAVGDFGRMMQVDACDTKRNERYTLIELQFIMTTLVALATKMSYDNVEENICYGKVQTDDKIKYVQVLEGMTSELIELFNYCVVPNPHPSAKGALQLSFFNEV